MAVTPSNGAHPTAVATLSTASRTEQNDVRPAKPLVCRLEILFRPSDLSLDYHLSMDDWFLTSRPTSHPLTINARRSLGRTRSNASRRRGESLFVCQVGRSCRKRLRHTTKCLEYNFVGTTKALKGPACCRMTRFLRREAAADPGLIELTTGQERLSDRKVPKGR